MISYPDISLTRERDIFKNAMTAMTCYDQGPILAHFFTMPRYDHAMTSHDQLMTNKLLGHGSGHGWSRFGHSGAVPGYALKTRF
jgi:hypothetical protein